MANYQNHLIDPSFFYSAIEEFAFDYDLYRIKDKKIDDYGKITYEYEKDFIRGSLQTDGLTWNQSNKGNTNSNSYSFYCKSLYRINIGDFIYYKNSWLLVNSVHEYDEWGVRSCTLLSVELSHYRDLKEYVDYISGEKIV